MKANVTLARTSKDVIRLTVKDELSRITFLELSMTPEDLGYIITGLSEHTVDMKVEGLDKVGKRKVVERRSVLHPAGMYIADIQKWLKRNIVEDGCEVSFSTHSKSSFSTIDGKDYINYSVVKWVENEAEETKAL
jgi:hypothetical protein